jgi:hypothetical protein
MKKVPRLLLLVGAVLLSAAPIAADAGFYVAAGRCTPGTRITSLPYTINQSGFYYLAGNLSYSGGTGIFVTADNVTIDLMGFSLTGPNDSSDSTGIWFVTTWRSATVPSVVGVWASSGANARVIGVRAAGNSWGIMLNGTGHLIKGCQATATGGGSAIVFGGVATVSGCMAICNTGWGIYAGGGGARSGNVVTGNGGTNSKGIYAPGGTPVLVMGNEVTNCGNGIKCVVAASILGNTVWTSSGQKGIWVNSPTLLDQNTVIGTGTHYDVPWGAMLRNNAG